MSRVTLACSNLHLLPIIHPNPNQMIHSTKQEGILPRPEFVPEADYKAALEGLAKFNKDEEERQSRLSEQLRVLYSKYNDSLIALLGKEKYGKWMAYKAALLEESLKWPVEEQPSEKYSIGARMREFFKANEMPVDRMRELVINRNLSHDKIMAEFYGPQGEKKAEKELDMAAIVPKSNGCSPEKYNYPWNGWQHGFGSEVNGYQVAEIHDINRLTGLVSSEVNARITQGDDHDYARATNHAQHGTWVHSGQGGYLEAFILAESLVDRHEIHAFDEEWQASWMYSRTRSDIMFHVIHPAVTGYARTNMSEFGLSLNDSGHYHHYDRSFLDYGSFHWAILRSRGPVPPNTWVYVRFGSALSMDVTSDDYKVNATVKAAWNIKTIFILCNGG